MNQRAKTIVFWTVLLVVAALLFAVVRSRPTPLKTTYSQFLAQVQSGEVVKATIDNAHSGANPVEYSLKDGTHLESVLPANYRDALDAMQQKLVNVEIEAGPQWPRFVANSAPFLILMGFWFFALWQMRRRDAGSDSRPRPL
jgi:ATP-dependent Zn protease